MLISELQREVVDEVPHPGEVGIALRRDAELPAHVVVLAEPVGVVEGRVGEGVVGAEVPECSKSKWASIERTARRLVVALLFWP